MSDLESFDEALDAGIDALRRGESMDAVLRAHAVHAPELRPLLEIFSRASATASTASPSMTQNFSRVRAALQQERRTALRDVRPWWQRPLRVASFSAPAGLFALFALGVAGAAAGTVAVTTTTDLPAKIERAMSGDGSSSTSVASKSRTPGAANGAPANSDGQTRAAGAPEQTHTPSANRPTATTIAGLVSKVRGNAFTLTNGADEWMVTLDGNSVVVGTIAEGGTATVTGDVTAQKNMHADSVDAVPPAQPPATATERTQPNPTHTPKPPNPNGNNGNPGGNPNAPGQN